VATAEVTQTLCADRNGLNPALSLHAPKPFEVQKEKSRIPSDRSAHRCTELVETECRQFARIVERSRVERVISQEVIDAAMKLVRTRFSDDIDLSRTRPAELR
jgi:hypothetical protein